MAMVFNGIDRPQEMDRHLKGKRLGYVGGGSAVTRDLRLAVDVLHERYDLRKLFNLVYGIRAEFNMGEEVPLYTDIPTGLPVYSVFNAHIVAPTPEMLQGLDAVVFDIKEAGARYYEYLYCMANLMRACAAQQVEVVVLDRVNPINAAVCEGNTAPEDMHQMVGDYGLAMRVGMTIGEVARYINGEYHFGCDLTVIPIEGWKRDLYLDETDLPWVLPSPSLPTVNSNIMYSAMCLVEGIATLSEGRGTTIPFQVVGAPWLDAEGIAQKMNAMDLGGVKFGTMYYKPDWNKYAGEVCKGVQIHIMNRREFSPVATTLYLLETIMHHQGEHVIWRDNSAGHQLPDVKPGITFERYSDKLLGDKRFTRGEISAAAFLAECEQQLKAYRIRKAPYELYE